MEKDQQSPTEARKKAQAAVKKRSSKGGISDYQYHIVIGGFILVCAVALGSAFMGDHRKLNQIPVIEDVYMSKGNAQEGKTYTLDGNDYFRDLKLSDAKLLISNQLSNKPSIYRCATESDTSIIPSSYDFFQQYPDCRREIPDQGNCSSGYSIAAVNALSDRFCMHTYRSQKQVRPELSAQTAISCDKEKNYQCQGGAVTTVLDYAKRQGLVDTKCLDYSASAETPCPTEIEQCEKYYVVDYCISTDIEGIKKEIYKNGPVVAIMTAYRDFMIYKKGIYSPEEGTAKFRSGQAVKIYGWGMEEIEGQNIEFWLIENSWGKTWGEDGTARVKLRISDNLLDQFALGAMPKVEKEAEPVLEGEQLEGEEKIETNDLDSDEIEDEDDTIEN